MRQARVPIVRQCVRGWNTLCVSTCTKRHCARRWNTLCITTMYRETLCTWMEHLVRQAHVPIFDSETSETSETVCT